ncbi:MAG: elongation factor G [Chloroflexi bacterium]|nr:elongation factor G [Chloroflexota bacterium]
MATYTTAQLRNVALLAHQGAGKTSLADALYFKAGVVNRLGRVDDQTSNSDFEPEEQSRGASIQTSVLPCPWNDHKVNVLDTPGYADFKGDMLSALQVADTGIIVISAVAGIEVGAAQAWAECKKRGLPRMIVVNKLDREHTDFRSSLEMLAESWGRECVAVNAPNGDEGAFTDVIDLVSPDAEESDYADLRERLIEAVAESDDELAGKYLEELTLSQDDLTAGLRAGIASGEIIPVVAASASAEVGTGGILDAICAYLPSPEDKTSRELPEVPSGASANFVFKTSADPFVGKISYFRVYGKPMTGDGQVWNDARGENERVGQIYYPKGKEQENATEIVNGDIGVVPKLSETLTGDTLTDKADPISLPRIEFPEPVYGLAVTPKTQADLDKMAEALNRIAEEDPSLVVHRDPETSQTVIRGLGDVHVETAVARIERKFGVGLDTDLPKIAYRETISATARSEYRHKKQSGGHGQYGHVVVELSPRKRGDGFNFASKVVGGNVPKEYIPSVEKGVKAAMAGGVLAGFPVVDVGVTLLDGSSHSVDSSGMAFEIAASFALRLGVGDARPVLLEPIMRVKVMTPDNTAGDVMSDLNGRRAQIIGMTPLGDGNTEIEAAVPLASMQRYATDLRSITQAQAVFSAILDEYAIMPRMEAEKVIAQYAPKEEVEA